MDGYEVTRRLRERRAEREMLLSTRESLQTTIGDLKMTNEELMSTNEALHSVNEERVEQRLRFETLLFDISARFMTIPFDQVDSEIDGALRQIMEFFQVDRCSLLEFQEDKAFAGITHAANGEGLEPISGEINLAELFPWC